MTFGKQDNIDICDNIIPKYILIYILFGSKKIINSEKLQSY